jgi:teichuronic acid biosynthesis glycosyltransferase TuaG
MHLVSIITPSYNANRFISSTVASVQQQTYQNWEMIIVDDCSRDNTARTVQQLMRADPRIRLIQQRVNSGPAAARDVGIELARGRYVAFLDSDDLWLPQKLERQLSFMWTMTAAFSFTQFRRISQTGESCGRVIPIPAQLDYYGLLKNTAIATSTVLIDRDQTGPFRMKKTYYDDFVLWLELTKRGFLAYGLREDLMRYRIVGQSVSRNKVNSVKWVWRTYREIEGFNRLRSSWYLANYAFNAIRKYARF